MEREIANVAAACAMRGFRYLAFPPIVFESPLESLPSPEPELAHAPVSGQSPMIVEADLSPQVASLTPEASAAISHAPCQSDLDPAASPPQNQRQVKALPEMRVPSAPPAQTPLPSPARPRFALLADVSAEIRRQTGL